MKTRVLGIFLMLVSVTMYAQKDELKAAEKALKKQNFTEAASSIEAAEKLMGSMDTRMKARFYYAKGQIFQGKKDYATATKAYNDLMAEEKKSGKRKYSTAADQKMNLMLQEVNKKAGVAYNSKDFKNAAKLFDLCYLMSPKDTTFLMNAAASASNAKDLDGALKYYMELNRIGYTGIQTLFYAVNKETGVKENLGTKFNRDIMVKSGNYKTPTNEKTESKRGTIIRNMAFILNAKGKSEEALKIGLEARKMYPNDLNLILTVADIYYKLDNKEKFGELMQEAIKQDPNNPTLFFNLGVISRSQGKKEDARKYYEKAVELKPDYADAYQNIAQLILDDEQAIVDEMNKNLSDFDKYDELLDKQKKLYKKALPYLEKADKYNRSLNTVQILMNFYETLLMEDKSKEYRALYQKMNPKKG